MGHCPIHGEYSRPEHWGCPECQAAQESAEATNANIEEALSALIEEAREKAESEREAAAKREENDARVIAELRAINKPRGEYACPACKLVSLIRGATRCPECHVDIETAFWEGIRRQEEFKRECEARAALALATRAAEEKRLAAEETRELQMQEKKRAAERAAEQAAAEEEERIKNLRILRILGVGAVVLFLLWMGVDKIRTVVRRNEFEQAIANKQTFRAQELARKLGARYATADGLRDLNEYDAAKKRFQEEGGANRDLIEKFGGDELAAAQALVKQAEENDDLATGAESYEQARKKILLIQSRLDDVFAARQAYKKMAESQQVTDADFKKYAAQEWAAAQQAVKDAETAAVPEAATAAYRQAAGLLSAFNEYGVAKEKFNNEASLNRELAEKFCIDDWVVIQELVRQAEASGDLHERIELFELARKKMSIIQAGLNDLILARQAWESFSNSIASVAIVNIQRCAPREWVATQQAVKSAETTNSLKAAIAAYQQAVMLLGSAVEKSSAPASVFKTGNWVWETAEYSFGVKFIEVTDTRMVFNLCDRQDILGKVVITAKGSTPGYKWYGRWDESGNSNWGYIRLNEEFIDGKWRLVGDQTNGRVSNDFINPTVIRPSDNFSGQTQPRYSSGSSSWRPAPSSWNSQNAPVAQPNKPSSRSGVRTAW